MSALLGDARMLSDDKHCPRAALAALTTAAAVFLYQMRINQANTRQSAKTTERLETLTKLRKKKAALIGMMLEVSSLW